MIIPAARRAIVLASDGDLGERLGVFYAAYLAGFVFGPPVAGLLTVVADVRLPFLVFGVAVAASSLSIRDVVIDEPGRRGAAGRPRRPAGAAPSRRRPARRSPRCSSSSRSATRSACSSRCGRRTSTTSAPSTMVVTISLTVFALPMLIIARPAGRLSDALRPAAVVGARRRPRPCR